MSIDLDPPDQAPGARDARLLAFPDSDERRLRRALHALDAALEEQRCAVVAFRTQLASLKTAVGRLGTTAQGLCRVLAHTVAEAEAAQAAARQLVTTAEAMEQAAQP